MSMNLEQLVYTSFPGIGFKNLVSNQIPAEIQDCFFDHIVLKHWNEHKPNPTFQQAVYIYQPTIQSCLFGWLYSDEVDEYGRNIPYFIGYYLAEALNQGTLRQVLACLQRGPIEFWDRHSRGQSIGSVTIPDTSCYEPARKGFNIPDEVFDYSYSCVKKHNLLNLLLVSDPQKSSNGLNEVQDQTELDDTELCQDEAQSSQVSDSVPSCTEELNKVLQEFVDKPIGIQSAFLVSAEGQPITTPTGMDLTSALILAGTMLYLVQSTSRELNWQSANKITIQSNEGYVILAQCSPKVFLMIQARPTLMGLLEGEINRTVQKLQVFLHRVHAQTASFVDRAEADQNERHLAAV